MSCSLSNHVWTTGTTAVPHGKPCDCGLTCWADAPEDVGRHQALRAFQTCLSVRPPLTDEELAAMAWACGETGLVALAAKLRAMKGK